MRVTCGVHPVIKKQKRFVKASMAVVDPRRSLPRVRSTAAEMSAVLRDNEERIAELTDEGALLRGTVADLENQVQELSTSLQQKEQEAKVSTVLLHPLLSS